MGRWLIGCGVLFVIVVAVLAVGAIFIAKEVTEMKDSSEEASAILKDVKEAHPFEAPPDRILTEERMEVYLRGRERLAQFVAEAKDEVKEGPALRRLMSGVNRFQAALPEFAKMLDEIGMSPLEYAWISQQISYVIQYSMRDEVLAEFPQMRELHELRSKPLSDRDETDDGFSNVEMWSEGERTADWSMISRIDPYYLTVPRANVEVVAKHSQRLIDSMTATTFEPFVVPMYLESKGKDTD